MAPFGPTAIESHPTQLNTKLIPRTVLGDSYFSAGFWRFLQSISVENMSGVEVSPKLSRRLVRTVGIARILRIA